MARITSQDGPARRTGPPARRTAAPSGAAAVAAGAQRASGERAVRRRRTTPLLADRAPLEIDLREQAVREAAEQGVEPVLETTADVTVAEQEPSLNGASNGAAGHGAAGPGVRLPVASAGSGSGSGSGTGRRPVAKRTVSKSAELPGPAAANGASGGASSGRRPPRSKVLPPPAVEPTAPSEPVEPAEPAEPVEPVGSETAETVEPVVPVVPVAEAPVPPVRTGRPANLRPGRRPVAKTTTSGSTTSSTTSGGTTSEPTARTTRPRRPSASRRTSGGERLVAVSSIASEAGEAIAEALGSVGADRGAAEEKIAGILAFLRRRLTGDYQVDEFGFDVELTDTVLLSLVRPLYQKWFRVEVRGVENIPDEGGALIVANHAGAIAFDSLMTQVAVHDEHPKHRHLRMLGADLVFRTPFVGEIARKGGATLASNADAERLLASGELVGVWPEGFKGIGKPFSERYKLQRFGRGGFVSAALRTRTPIIPCAIVGSEETYPIIGDMPTVARLLGLPYAPVTPTWPLLGPLGLIPLPSKWLIEFGTPVPTNELGVGAADDPMLVFDLTDQVRQTIQHTLYQLLVQRRSVFF